MSFMETLKDIITVPADEEDDEIEDSVEDVLLYENKCHVLHRAFAL